MEYIKYVILLIFLLALNKSFVNTQELCPKNCECDSFENFNRANCRGRKLISASLEISEYVQVFDLDENEITVLDNDCFKKQIHITNLSIAYNAIHTIYLNAFSTLKKLKSIDLSYNRLEYINEKIFEYNYQLVEVNLSGNKFMSFPNQPLFISSTVQNLLIQNSQITHIYPKFFSKIPSLEHLDLSENLMITLTTEPFNPLEKLLTVNLDNNRWICDKNIENVVKLLKNKQITVKLNMCHFELRKIDGNNGMFEKIIIDPNLNIETNEEKSQIIIESVWKIINEADNELESCSESNVPYACNLYKNCLTNLTIITEILENSQNNLKQLNTNKDFFRLIDDTQLVFYFGMCIGAALVFVMVAFTFCAAQCCKTDNKKIDLDVNDVVSADAEFRYLHLERAPSALNRSMVPIDGDPPPPIPVRIPVRVPVRNSRRRRHRAPPPPPPFNRSISTPGRTTPVGTVNDFAAFVTRLFERPARHRYYRAFNENTAHLIRRLSRSSLVNNRLSQHFLNETTRNRTERNINNNGNQEFRREQEPLNATINSSNDEEDIMRELFVQLPDQNDNSNSRLMNNWRMSIEEYNGPAVPRSETPPPSYVEVVKG